MLKEEHQKQEEDGASSSKLSSMCISEGSTNLNEPKGKAKQRF
jgi:hypothetical protein